MAGTKVRLEDDQVPAFLSIMLSPHQPVCPACWLPVTLEQGQFQVYYQAESSGLLEKLDKAVLPTACTQLKSWRESGLDLSLAVNLSNRKLEGDPANLIRRILLATGVDPGSLQIEIAEEKMKIRRTRVLK